MIVSGDNRLRNLKTYQRIPIVGAADAIQPPQPFPLSDQSPLIPLSFQFDELREQSCCIGRRRVRKRRAAQLLAHHRVLEQIPGSAQSPARIRRAPA